MTSIAPCARASHRLPQNQRLPCRRAHATVRFRGAAAAGSLDVAGYLEQLGRRAAAQVTGQGRWSREGVERGPYLDFTWTAPEDPFPACRAWGEDGAPAVGWVCAADAATALEVWEAVTA